MEIVVLFVVIICVLAYYNVMKSIEIGARIATEEVEFLAKTHKVSTLERMAKLNERLNEKTMKEATEAMAKINALD